MSIPLFDTLKWTENTKHALIQAMSSQTENGNSEDLDKYARLLYDTAIIGEGEAIDDPRDFADRLVDVMEAALKQKLCFIVGAERSRFWNQLSAVRYFFPSSPCSVPLLVRTKTRTPF